ncbi:MAG TPA: tetratricopeptide repeat protein [Gemmatimonadales bacterium]|nr:tetratricopeptide repeat protein [Gemmatimonadales bacterium]
MRDIINLTPARKERIGTIVVGLVLMAAIVLTGCDIPSGKRDTGVASDVPNPVATTVAAGSLTETPVASEPATTVPAVVTYEDAERVFREGRYSEAEGLFSAYVERKPENSFGYYMLGLSAWKAGDHERAVQALTRAFELDRTHVKSHLNLARVLLETGKSLEALERLDTALTLDSTSNVVYRLRGRALADLGHTDAAADAYRRALVLDPSDVWSMNNLGLLFFQQGWYDEALYPLARAVALDSAVATFQNNLGMALEHTGRYAQAAEAYKRAIAADPTYVKANANLARVEGRENDPLIEPADFGALAAEFERQMQGWGSTVVGVKQ